MSSGPISAVEIAKRVHHLIEQLIDVDEYAREVLDLLGLLTVVIACGEALAWDRNDRRTALVGRIEIAEKGELGHLFAGIRGVEA